MTRSSRTDTITFEVTGESYQLLLQKARGVAAEFFGHPHAEIIEFAATPFLETLDARTVSLWRAEVTAEWVAAA